MQALLAEFAQRGGFAFGAEVLQLFDLGLQGGLILEQFVQCSAQFGFFVFFEASRLDSRLVHAADEFNADMIATVCPMCQLNLDAYQNATNKHFGTDYEIPIVFFTQLIGLALGLEAKALGFGREMVSARKALGWIGVEPPPPLTDDGPAKPRRRKKKEGLPMPQMRGDREVEP